MISQKIFTRSMLFHPWSTYAQNVSALHTKDYTPEFPIFSAYKLPLCGLVVSIDMNTYKLTGVRNLKTLKENYSISLRSCNSFTKNMLNMESNIILMVLIAHEKIKFLANLDGSRILGGIGIKRGILFKLNTLFGKHLCWPYLGLLTDWGWGQKDHSLCLKSVPHILQRRNLPQLYLT